MQSLIRAFFLMSLIPVIVAAGCGDQATNQGKNAVEGTVDNAFLKYLTEVGGYTALPIPSSLERGGSLVYLKTENNKKSIEWVDDLVSCGLDPDILFGKADTEEKKKRRDERENGRFPDFNVVSENDFGIQAVFSIKGVGANAKLGSIRKAIFTAESAGKEQIRRLAVAGFLSDPLRRNKLEPHCLKALETQKVAVLVDVAFIDKGTVEFFADNGAEAGLKLPAAEVIKALDLSADAKANLDAQATMNIDERVYVAFKEAFYVSTDGTLAGSEDELEDATKDLKDIIDTL